MDIEAYVAQHQPQWERLAALSSLRRPTGAEADELVALYQRASTQLAVVRGSAYDPELDARLTSLVTNARAAITGGGGSTLNALGRFFAATVPAALYRIRWWALGIALACLGLAVVVCLRCLGDPALLHHYLSDAEIDHYVNVAFAGYYSASPSSHFAVQVWLNNAMVTATCVLLGVAVLPALVVLWTNMEQLGYVAALMINRERADVFFGMLLPHGMLELTCIFFGGAAGLRMAWAWLSPGGQPRSQTLGREGRTMAAVIVGLAMALGVSGLLEGYVTPALLAPSVRLGIGLITWLAFLVYVVGLGGRAHRAGHDGDVVGATRTHVDPVEGVM